ncbi:amidohydrolase family protein, partial [Ligaoa zhengdingensis]
MLLRDISVVDENYEVREHQNIITEGDAIAYIGPELPADYRGESYDGRNKAAMPGFFNAHCHVPMTLIRGYGEGLPLDRWLNERMFPFEALLTADDMYWGALLGIAELLQSGAVSFTDMY